jgi:phosphoenolpyruvate carboxylase
MIDALAATAEAAYRELVWDDPAFEEFFALATPIDEVGRMELGSRPARRGASRAELADLRAIPWVFAWSQSRINLPAWFGVGSALRAYARSGSTGRRRLAEAYRSWPFFRSVIDNVELGVALADPGIGSRYAALAGDDPDMRRIAGAIDAELALTVRELGRITGHARPLEGSRRLRRSIDLRTPYVDVLSELQLHALTELRGRRAPGGGDARDLFHLTVAGIAAGLQHTG